MQDDDHKEKLPGAKTSQQNDSWFSEISNMMASPEDSDVDCESSVSAQSNDDTQADESWENHKGMFIEKKGHHAAFVNPDLAASDINANSNALNLEAPHVLKSEAIHVKDSHATSAVDCSAQVSSKPNEETHVAKSVFVKPPTRRRKKKYY